jgi:hypothetical protein
MADSQDWLAQVLGRWEKLFEEVDYDNVPLELIERMVIHLKDGKIIELDIKQMAKEYSLSYDKFEQALEIKLDNIESNLDHIEWHLDTTKAVEEIEHATNTILKDI